MKVIIKKLSVKEKDSLVADIVFYDVCTLLTCDKNDIVIDIIKLLIGSSEDKNYFSCVSFDAEVMIDDIYHITGKKINHSTKWSVSVNKENSEGDFTDEYFSLINKSKEELSVTHFMDFEKQNYPLRLAYYKDNKHYYKGGFSARTNGIGETRSFRVYLNEFIKNYNPELINKENDLWLSLKDDGEFIVTKGSTGKETKDLNSKDLFVYNLLCFLNLVRFWDGFNEIRNINTEKTPVAIKLPDNCDFDYDSNILKINRMDRQVVVLKK